MFHDPLAGATIDYVGGRRDLRRKVIRAIGQPEHRFDEDHLRMLRAVRFSVRFGFAIEPATALAIRHHAGRIVRISGERVREELEKMLARPSAPQALEQLHELGLLEHILPELFSGSTGVSPVSGGTGLQPVPDLHGLRTRATKEGLWPLALQRVRLVARRGDGDLNLAALLGELDRHQIEAIARRWGASNRLREDLVWLAAHLRDWQKMPTAELAAVKILMAGRQFARLRILWRLDERLRTGGVACNRRIALRIRRIPTGQVAPAPLVSGADLKVLGLSEGPRLGRILSALYRAQLNEEVATRGQAMYLAAGLIGKE
jgi:tRNA nucleotidyltransferase/poly(A) polymerase